MKCSKCGTTMRQAVGHWLCDNCGHYEVVVPKRGSNKVIGYCAKCGQFVQRLHDFDVSGLCDDCSDEELKVIQKAIQNFVGNMI